ncbi:MAG: hypothetical protein ABIT37_09985 [Luteolibacter sp.]
MKHSLIKSKDFLSKSGSYMDILCAIVLVLAFGCHFYAAAVTAVDVPFWDDWGWFPKECPAWIFAFDNEHRCVPTRLLIAIQFAINGWDIRSAIITNFILFGLTLLVYVRFLLSFAKRAPKWSIYLLSICVLSPLAIEAHHWGIGSAWHFPMLFGILGTWQLFHPDTKTIRDVVGSFLLVLCLYSVGSGLVISFSIIATWMVFRAGLALKAPNIPSWKVALTRMSPAVGIYFIALVLWFDGYKKIAAHGEPAGPFTSHFWNFLGILLQNGFAFPRHISLTAPWLGFLVLIPYLVIPACYFMGRHIFTRRTVRPEVAGLIALSLGLLGVAALTSYGRGNFPIGFTNSGRYLIFLLYMIPVSVLLWAELLTPWKKLRSAWLAISCIVFLGLQLRLIPLFAIYNGNMVARQEQVRLIKGYYKNGEPKPFYIPGFWLPIDPYLDLAKQKNYSFYRKIHSAESPK